MTKIPILITAIGGGGHGEQILKAIQLAPGNKYFVVGADANPICPQLQLVDERVRLPLADDPGYVDALLKVCSRYKIKALFHGCEPELKLFSKNRSLIEKQGILLPINPQSVIDTCMDKVKTNLFLSGLGFDPPRFVEISTKEMLKEIEWFPVVVKPYIGSGGSVNVYIAQSTKELLGLADYLGLEDIAGRFFIQEYVGTPEEEYTVGVLHDMDGNYLNSIAVKRLLSGQLNIRMSIPNRTFRKELGPKLVISSGISHGHIGRFPEVTEQCREISEALNVKGPINIQCRLVNGKVKVFEMNPRFSGTTSLRAMVGYNEPDVLIQKHIFGEATTIDFPYEDAVILRSLRETRL